jgi:hypothetical protein
MPSERLRLEAKGFSAGTAYDFDRAVMTLARVVDARQKETVDTLKPEPKKAPKGMVRAQKPKYTMMQLLYDEPDEELADGDASVPESLRNLPTALL